MTHSRPADARLDEPAREDELEQIDTELAADLDADADRGDGSGGPGDADREDDGNRHAYDKPFAYERWLSLQAAVERIVGDDIAHRDLARLARYEPKIIRMITGKIGRTSLPWHGCHQAEELLGRTGLWEWPAYLAYAWTTYLAKHPEHPDVDDPDIDDELLAYASTLIERHVQAAEIQVERQDAPGTSKPRWSEEAVAIALGIRLKDASAEERSRVKELYEQYGRDRNGPRPVTVNDLASIMGLFRDTASLEQMRRLWDRYSRIMALSQFPASTGPEAAQDGGSGPADSAADIALYRAGYLYPQSDDLLAWRTRLRPRRVVLSWLRNRGRLVLENEPELGPKPEADDASIGFGLTVEQLRWLLRSWIAYSAGKVARPGEPDYTDQDSHDDELRTLTESWLNDWSIAGVLAGKNETIRRGMAVVRKILYAGGALGPAACLQSADGAERFRGLFDATYCPYGTRRPAGLADRQAKETEFAGLGELSDYLVDIHVHLNLSRYRTTSRSLFVPTDRGLRLEPRLLAQVPPGHALVHRFAPEYRGTDEAPQAEALTKGVHDMERAVAARLGRPDPDCVRHDGCTVEGYAGASEQGDKTHER